MVLDIETAAGSRARDEAAAILASPYPYDERFPPDNYKKEETIAKWRAADEANWPKTLRERADALLKEAALSPRLGRIVCVGIKCTEDDSHVVSCLDPADERGIVDWAVGQIGRAKVGDGVMPVVTFNGLTFDLPFLQVRAAVHGVDVRFPMAGMLARYRTDPHADLRAILTNWDTRTSGTLHEWCAAFGIGVTDTTTGADIGAMVERGDADGIRAHCLADLDVTYQLAHKLRAAGMI